MIYLRLHDRLGNILFMIAAALHLDKDVSVFCNNEKDLSYVKRLVNRLNLPINIGSPGEHISVKYEYYTPTVYKQIQYTGDEMIMDGYFQSYRYFTDIEVRQLFTCPEDIDEAIRNEWGGVLHCKTVSLHVRRGDYLELPERFPFVGLSYIRKAMNRFAGSETVFIVTSDDIEWCKQNIRGENVYYSEGHDQYYDLFLASKCKHNILSNSTFSWWGAYLNTNPDKIVIVPKRWYGPVLAKEANEKAGELIPQSWERIPCSWDSPKLLLKAYYKYVRCYWRELLPWR